MSLLQEQIDEDISALETELEKISVSEKPKVPEQKPKRQTLPPELPRMLITHEPESTTCACGCELQRIGEDISEKLDYTPGTFHVERHIRGKWTCQDCDTLIREPVAPHIIDKGIPTTNLLAQVLVSKYADHQPLYRQQQIYARAGIDIPRSTLSDWVGRCGVVLTPLISRLREVILQHGVLHADETPVSMPAPGKKSSHLQAITWACSRISLNSSAWLGGTSRELIMTMKRVFYRATEMMSAISGTESRLTVLDSSSHGSVPRRLAVVRHFGDSMALGTGRSRTRDRTAADGALAGCRFSTSSSRALITRLSQSGSSP